MSLTVKVSKLDMRNVIESDYTPVFNPFEDYFAHIPPWKEGDKDYIAELAATVKVKDTDSSVPVGWTQRRSTMSSWSISEDRVPTRPPGSIISFRRS